MSDQDKQSIRPKSAYRRAPTRVVFRRDLETGVWAFVKNRIFYPVKQRTIHIFRQLNRYRTTHPHYYIRTGYAVVIGAMILIPIFGIVGQDSAVKAKVIRSIEALTRTQVLSVATVSGRSTVYDEDGLMHGFGYDVARQYASHLGIELRMFSFDNHSQALEALANGDVDLALLSTPHLQKNTDVVISPLACSDDEMEIFRQAGIDEHLAFISVKGGDIANNVDQYLCNDEFQEDLSYLAKFHNKTLLDNAYNARHFEEAIKKLSLLEHGFKSSAKEFNHDWQLLAMIGYQESHLNANAISPTGVQGIMMLTQDTAEMMGIKDRNNATQSIYGGAKYLKKLQEQFHHIPESDRLWFVLAAYNMGPNAVRDIQARLIKQGKDPNLWLNVYAYMSKHANKNNRYRQCITYVTNIRAYLEAIKRRN